MAPKSRIIPIFIPFAGCPVRCVYCDQHRITRIENPVTPELVRDLAEAGIRRAQAGAQVAFYGGSFTMLPVSTQDQLLESLTDFMADGRISGVRISTRPEDFTEAVGRRLRAHGVDTVEFGIQSVDRDVLAASRRGITFFEMEQSVQAAKASGFAVGLQQMIGLPEDDREKSTRTAEWIAEYADFVRIYPTVVFENTELYDRYRSGSYRPLSLKEAIDRTVELLEYYEAHRIPVIRVGLPSMARDAYVIGPYHDQFRGFCESLRRVRKIEASHRRLRAVSASPEEISRIVGPYGCGKKRLEKRFGPIVFRPVPHQVQIETESWEETCI